MATVFFLDSSALYQFHSSLENGVANLCEDGENTLVDEAFK